MSRGRPPTAPIPVLRYLALRIGWFVLTTFHREGLDAATERLGYLGGAGTDDDGVWRSFVSDNGGRHLLYREQRHDAPPRRVATREVLVWAERQLTGAEWAHVECLLVARKAAIDEAFPDLDNEDDTDGDPGQDGIEDDDERVRAAHRRMADVERQIAAVVRAALGDTGRGGDQLALFG